MNCGSLPCAEASVLSSPPPVGEQSRGRWVLIATVLGSSMEFIDGTVVNVALPSLQAAFNATGTQVQWVVEAYALFLSALLLVGGSLGDRFGLRRVFLVGVTCFATASIWCGVAPNLQQLLFARCLQGIGGALLVPNSLALLSATFPAEKRGRAIGTWSGFASMMTALGPVVGGWMVQHGSWRWVFFLNVPIGIVTVWIILRKTQPIPGASEQKQSDWKGALLATTGLSGVTFALMEWSSGRTGTRVIGVAGVALLVAFLSVERRTASPMLPLDLFRSRSFAGANVLTFFLYGALSAALFYLPLNLIQVQGYSPTAAGAAMLPLVALMFLLSRWAGGLLDRYGARIPLIIGPLILSAGYALLGRPGLGGSYWQTYFPAIVVLGLGMSISVAPLTTAIMGSVDQRKAGAASGVNNAVSQIAALLALAISAPLFFHTFAGSLAHRLEKAGVEPRTAQQIEGQNRRLAGIQTTDARGRIAIDGAFITSFRWIAFLASASAAAAAATAAVTIDSAKSSGRRGNKS